MTETDCLAIAVGKVDVAEVTTREPQRVCDVGFLDVRVEQIDEEFYVLGPERLEQFESIGDGFDEIGFVTIERFEEQGTPWA